ncbi:hypothetical protein T484DRAFT_1912747 [Baffinella frigidus]|nr:hypothetical protein T484DRAFT_1912747 [Cryptophyta sp. CCMP2293]
MAALARLRPISLVLGWGDETTNALATSTGTMARLDSWARFALLSTSSRVPAGSARCRASQEDARHTVVFMMTDGDSVTWTNGMFASADYDWFTPEP